ncbi:MAG: hypothetical protein AAF423_11700 [Pseudomonadota bacterium]
MHKSIVRVLILLSFFLSASVQASDKTKKISDLTDADYEMSKQMITDQLWNVSDILAEMDIKRYSGWDVRVALSQNFKSQNMPKVKLLGLSYFLGHKVKRDYKAAALLLMAAYLSDHRFFATRFDGDGYKGAETFTPVELDILAFVSHHTAKIYQRNVPDLNDNKFALMYHDFASEAGHQLSKLALGYRHRNIRPSSGSYQILAEHQRFKEASDCRPERLEREITPWVQELCDIASVEFETSEKRRDAYMALKAGEDAAYDEAFRNSGEISSIEFDRKREAAEEFARLLVGAVSHIIADAATNPQRQVITDYHEKQQEWIRQQEESTWGHIGAAMLVP